MSRRRHKRGERKSRPSPGPAPRPPAEESELGELFRGEELLERARAVRAHIGERVLDVLSRNAPSGTVEKTGLTLPQAEALLDCLHTYGRTPAEVDIRPDGFAVRFPGGAGRPHEHRPPPA
jgi:hypothetical protein